MNWIEGHQPYHNSAIIMKNESCNVQTDDGDYVLVASFSEAINKNKAKVQEFLNNFPRLNEQELLAASDGVYNWLIYETKKDPELKFVATEILSPFEIGTLHNAMANDSRLNIKRIFGGGELLKRDSSIEFNTLSGTFMGQPKEDMTSNEGENYEQHVKDLFNTFIEDATYTTISYTSTITNVPYFILDFYKDIGCIVLLFKTEKECNKTKLNIDFLEGQLDVMNSKPLKKPKTYYNTKQKLADIYRGSIHSPNNIFIQNTITRRNSQKREKIRLNFLKAAVEGNIDYIETILSNNAVDINTTDYVGNTALIFAIKKNHKDIVELLLEYNADINIKNQKGETALMCAKKKRDPFFIDLLLDASENTNEENFNNNTNSYVSSSPPSVAKKNAMGRALLEAIKGNDEDEVDRLLLLPGTDITYKDPDENNNNQIDIITLAIRKNNIAILEKLWLFAINKRLWDIAERLNTSIHNTRGRALLEAIKGNNEDEVAQLLLLPGIDITYEDPEENDDNRIDIITLAIRKNNIPILKKLWIFAVNNGFMDIAQRLIISINNRNKTTQSGTNKTANTGTTNFFRKHQTIKGSRAPSEKNMKKVLNNYVRQITKRKTRRRH